MNMQALLEKRANIYDQMKSLLDGNPSGLTDDQNEQYARMSADYDRVTADITRGEEMNERERVNREYQAAAQRSADTKPEPSAETLEQRQVKAMEQYVRFATPIPRELRATTDPQSLTAADGGYTVPNLWLNKLIAVRERMNIMRRLATVIQSNSGTLTIPTVTHGVAAWIAEGNTVTTAKETFSYKSFSAYKAGRTIKVTSELLNDSIFDIGGYVMGELGRSIGALEESDFIAGGDTTEPNGIFSAATTGVTAASETAITSDELLALFHSVSEPYRVDASWIMKDSTALLIRKLKDGESNYLWQPGLAAGQPDMLLGRPVYTSDSAPAATAGLDSVLFGWVGGYYIVDRVGMQLKRLVELYAETDVVGFQGILRTDGDLVDTSAVRVLTMA